MVQILFDTFIIMERILIHFFFHSNQFKINYILKFSTFTTLFFHAHKEESKCGPLSYQTHSTLTDVYFDSIADEMFEYLRVANLIDDHGSTQALSWSVRFCCSRLFTEELAPIIYTRLRPNKLREDTGTQLPFVHVATYQVSRLVGVVKFR